MRTKPFAIIAVCACVERRRAAHDARRRKNSQAHASLRVKPPFPGYGAASGTRGVAHPPTNPDPQAIVLASEGERSRNPGPFPAGTSARAERVERVGEQLTHARGEGCWRL